MNLCDFKENFLEKILLCKLLSQDGKTPQVTLKYKDI